MSFSLQIFKFVLWLIFFDIKDSAELMMILEFINLINCYFMIKLSLYNL
jgi:hypothetical protein